MAAGEPAAAPIDGLLAERIARSIALHSTFGYCRLWALLRFGEKVRANRKAVYRMLRLKRWLVHQRTVTPRPQVQGRRSRAQRSDQRWATHIYCGADGCAISPRLSTLMTAKSLATILRCAHAQEAERALESPLRFGAVP